jgi:hypothetical protein
LFAQRAFVEQAEAVGLAAQVDVLGDAAVRQQVELLVDHADAGALGVQRVREGDPAAEERDLALVRLVGAPEDLHQRRLAGAVLAHERVDLADAAGEVDAGDGGHGAEALDDAAHLERRLARRRARSGWMGRGIAGGHVGLRSGALSLGQGAGPQGAPLRRIM